MMSGDVLHRDAEVRAVRELLECDSAVALRRVLEDVGPLR